MANGFYGTDKEWERIESPLRRLDGILSEFANSHNLELIKSDKEWPSRSFRWGKKPSILIQVFLESEKYLTFTFWVSATDDRSRETYWLHKTLIKAKQIDVFETIFPIALEEAYSTAVQWINTYDST